MSIARRKHRKGGEQLTWEILVESLEPLVTNFPTSNPSRLDAYDLAPCRCTCITSIHTHCPSHHPPDNPQGLDTGSTTFEVGSFCLPTMTCCGNKNRAFLRTTKKRVGCLRSMNSFWRVTLSPIFHGSVVQWKMVVFQRGNIIFETHPTGERVGPW